MSTHYINPDDEYRDCESCGGSGYAPGCTETDLSLRGNLWACLMCDGTGKLGDKDAKPEIEVIEWRSGVRTMYSWKAAISGFEDDNLYPTEAEALAAARKALKQ